MMPHNMHAGEAPRPEPTMLETQLDSIALTLAKMKSKLRNQPLLDHLSRAERAELQMALSRVKCSVNEVGDLIAKGDEPPPTH